MGWQERSLSSGFCLGRTRIITEDMNNEFEAAKEEIGKNLLLNACDVNRKTMVVTDASGDGLGHILLQKKEDGPLMEDTGYVVIQVGSAALKPAWRNYSALELEATCVVFLLETLAFYLKGCPKFNLWMDH